MENKNNINDIIDISHLLNNLNEAIFIISDSGDLKEINKSCLKIISLTDRSLNKLKKILFHELEIDEVLRTKNDIKIKLRKINILDHSYLVNSFFHNNYLIIILSEITDIKNMAKDLSKQLIEILRLKTSLDYIKDGIIISDAFENILFMNKSIKDILFLENYKQDIKKLSELDNFIDSNFEKQENNSFTSFSIDKNGEKLTYLIEKETLFIRDGKIQGFLLYFSNITPINNEHAIERNKIHKTSYSIVKSDKTDKTLNYKNKSIQNFVGQSKAVQNIKSIIKKVAPSSSTVLLQSESGTGKELLARALHELSDRVNGPFIKINCASLPESLLEAEVFGYDSGAFTGAKKSGNPGLFEQAHTGTIFLDELGEMSLALQAKLLRVIQEREVQRIGGQSSKQLDVRIVAATNRNLLQLTKEKRFRSDLLFRLNVISITIPPLRERKEDIKSLIIYFIRIFSQIFKKNISGVSTEVYNLFIKYDWPGNVRELSNIIEYAFNIIDGNIIEIKHLPKYLIEELNIKTHKELHNLDDIIEDFTYNIVMENLEQHMGNKILTAASLGISRAKLYRIISKYENKLVQ